ncbi:MAG: PTS sugar transporter subunit IIA [Treponema sp.]|nr:PTS sugar transporter subunit IIA [Treponema sp.]
MNEIKNNDTLALLVKRGGIFYGVGGSTRREIMANVIENITVWNPEKREMLLQAVMEREAIISTGIENGIALPHPRTPMLEDDEEPFVVIAFPQTPSQDWLTPDNSSVHAIFLIVSKSPKQHLGVMSGISYLCQQEQFYKMLSMREKKEKIITAIEKAESEW